jgi:hypothetical protein
MNQLEALLLGKSAEVSGTDLAPLSPSPRKTDPKLNPVGVKTAQPYVNVEGHDAPAEVLKKTAERYALPAHERYPLDSYEQVKTASAYFDEWERQMEPLVRREFCSNLVKRASELGIKVSSRAERYGGDVYATQSDLRIARDSRMSILKEASHQEVLRDLFEAQPTLDPMTFARGLDEFDKHAGIYGSYGVHIEDPYYAVLGSVKVAEEHKPEGIVIGNDYLSKSDLKEYSMRSGELVPLFGKEMADEFRNDPEGVFNSLPLDQKKVVMRRIRDRTPVVVRA